MSYTECAICSSSNIKHITKDEVFTYKGESFIVEDYTIYHCQECGLEVVAEESNLKSDAALEEMMKEVDLRYTSDEIVEIRKNLGKTQKEMSAIFGGGVNSFAKYESGDTRPSVCMSKLLKAANVFGDELLKVIAPYHFKKVYGFDNWEEKILYFPTPKKEDLEYTVSEQSVQIRMC